MDLPEHVIQRNGRVEFPDGFPNACVVHFDGMLN
jgi:hypothetical protein